MSKKVYCLRCDKEVLAEEPVEGHSEFVYMGNGFGDVIWCAGPFSESEPPELEEDWNCNLQDPSPAELEEMNANAEELLLDFEG